MDWYLWLGVGLYCVVGFGGLAIAIYYDDHSGSFVHDDGRIVEWNGNGGGRILYPNGTVKEFPP